MVHSVNIAKKTGSFQRLRSESTTPPQADGVSEKDFHLKAVASVTLDPNCNNFPTSKHYPGK